MVRFRQYRFDDRDWVLNQNIRHYRTAEGFDHSFEGVVTDVLVRLEQQIDDARSQFIIAEIDGRRIGCIFFGAEDQILGRIKLFFLTKANRGKGIGKRMLHLIIYQACQLGFETIRVSSFERHRDACGLYAATGFKGKTGDTMKAFGQFVRPVDFEYDLNNRR